MVGIGYDGMIRGGKAQYAGETPQCSNPKHVQILVYEQCDTDPNVYGEILAHRKDKLNSLIFLYKNELKLFDIKVKIKKN